MIVWSLADIFIAGTETTSTTLRWFFLYMLEYPDIMKKVQKEIDNVIGRDSSPTWGDNVR
jgi:cytochrome P450